LDRYQRARISARGSDEGASFNELEDSLWAFFQNCWHINDWIRNDPTLTQPVKDAVWKEVRNTTSILIAADLANGSKHFSTDPSRQKVGSSDTAIQFRHQPDGTIVTEHVIAVNDGKRVLAIELAKKAMADWQDILRRNGLLYFSAPSST
jgi:hypothetical protein